MASASGEMKQKQGFNEVSSMPSCIGNSVFSYCHPKGHGNGSSLSTDSSDGVSDGHGHLSNGFNGVSDGHGGCSSGVFDGHGSFSNTDSFGGVSNGHGRSSNTDSVHGVSDGHGRSSSTDNVHGVSDGHGRLINTDDFDGISDGHGRLINPDCHAISSNTDTVEGVSKSHGRFDGHCEEKQGCYLDHQNGHDVTEAATSTPAKRPFCKRCRKVQKLCICMRFKGVVQNRIKVTILQNPEEKHHAVGSARVALLGLQNIALVNLPEVHTKESFRIRPKVRGSKRSLAGRGGKKLLVNGGSTQTVLHNSSLSEAEVLHLCDLLVEIFKDNPNHIFPLKMLRSFMHLNDSNGMADEALPLEKLHSFMHLRSGNVRPPEEDTCIVNGSHCEMHCEEENGIVDGRFSVLDELETLTPPGVALLYPSEKAVELSDSFYSMARHGGQEVNFEGHPCHLIVLDGTWSKAKRMYFENPWLQSIPHYKLSLSSPSLYEGVRKQPKPGCLSTLESIVYALKVLEPETKGLDGLLEVFDSMVEDQRRCKQMKSFVLEYSTG